MNLFKTLFHTTSKSNNSLENQLFMHSAVPTVITDEKSTIVMHNAAFSTLTGYTKAEIVGERISLFKTGRHDSTFYKERRDHLLTRGSYEGEIWSRCKDQSECLLIEKVSVVHHQSKRYHQYMVEDITESRKLADRYRYLAMHDALTGLANRSLAKDRFSHALLNSVRAGEKLGILLCDLNEFKQVNDTYGHHVGDLFLIEIGKKLTQLVREGDTVARIGGDEFLVILERLESEDELEFLAEKIQKEIQVSFDIEGNTIDARMSIGAVCSPRDGMNYEDLLKVADHKMYKDKERYYGF